MRVMLYEPDHQGHRLTYVRYVAEAVLETGCEVILATSDYVVESLEFRLNLSHLLPRMGVDIWQPRAGRSWGLLGGFAATAGRVQETIAKLRADHVLVVMADGVSQALGYCPGAIPKQVELEGLLMRGRWAYPSGTWKQKFRTYGSLRLTARAPWTRLYHLDELAVEALQKRGHRLARISHLMPHAIETPAAISQAQARALLGLDAKAQYFSCLGVLNERKGIAALLEAIQRPACPADLRLLLMGKTFGTITELVHSKAVQGLIAAGKITVIDRYVTSEELAAGFAASDCVVALYRDTYLPASIVLHAAAYGKPVLGSDSGWIGQMVSRLALGWRCDPGDPGAIAAAMEQASRGVGGYRPSPAAGEAVRFHTVEAFKARWTERLRQRLGRDVAVAGPPSA